MRKEIFKVYCEFYVRANSQSDVEDYLKEEAGLDFAESHLIIEPLHNKIIKKNDVYVNL